MRLATLLALFALAACGDDLLSEETPPPAEEACGSCWHNPTDEYFHWVSCQEQGMSAPCIDTDGTDWGCPIPSEDAAQCGCDWKTSRCNIVILFRPGSR